MHELGPGGKPDEADEIEAVEDGELELGVEAVVDIGYLQYVWGPENEP